MKMMLITSLLLMIMTIQATAFDGQRRGFVIGGGLGGGTIAFKDEVTRLGQDFSFNVGFAPTKVSSFSELQSMSQPVERQ